MAVAARVRGGLLAGMLGALAGGAVAGQAPPPAEVLADYHAWAATQPAEVRDRYPESYKAHLASLGFDPPAIERRIALIDRAEGARGDAFLAEVVEGRAPGRALTVGGVSAPAAAALIGDGWEVTGLVDSGALDGPAGWDLIILRQIDVSTPIDALVGALADGGLLVVDAPHPRPATLLARIASLRVVRFEDVGDPAAGGGASSTRIVRLAAVKTARE